ncbi:integrator complex subunit 6-like [Peromyscus californicus insignis]|uniref:integrator complex subunit 6-like n=1 Tax=Peromyscus californicus insignis TaxID=564181 RepID=UPI0022A7FC30|nr:integrator complex subunit 6-like [Peromyscus californicus insignis]XP_052595687.1 integrator complex subunit 6-like [Peromyscus californicus insignis]XP_052595694.1 integrator complex subunit 6-like [Peromyscus californicus insignis]
MMAEKSEELSVRSEKEEDPAGEAVDPTLPPMGSIVTMMPVEEEEEEPHLKASFTANVEGATVSPNAQEGVVKGGPTAAKGSPKWVPRNNAPSAKSSYLSSAGLLPEGGDGTFAGGTVSREVPPRVTAAADRGRVPNGYPVSREKLNAEIKRQLMKEIRRYGRKYGRIFKLLEEVQGPLEVQIQFIEFTIKEAARFKRRHLIQFLEKKREEILSHSFLSNSDPPADM